MFQYVLALLLINTYYQSSGSPVPAVNTISNYLLDIKQCGIKFVSEQINSKSQDCNVTASLYSDKQIHCLMFYDINKQLCSSAAASKLLQNEDYAAKINERQDIDAFCDSAKDFIFTNLTEVPGYKVFAEKIFKNSLKCGKACGYSGLTNLDTKYYCKYFKWGFDVLNNKTTATTSQAGAVSTDNSNADLYVNGVNDLNHKPSEQAKPGAEITTEKGKFAKLNGEQAAEASLAKPEQDLTVLNAEQAAVASLAKPEKDLPVLNEQQTAEASLAKPITNDHIPAKPKPNADTSGDVDLSVDGSPPNNDTNNGTNTKPASIGQEANIDKDEQEDGDIHQNSDEYDNGPEEGNVGVQSEIDAILGAQNNIPKHVKDIAPNKEVEVSHKAYPRTEVDEFPEEGDNFFPFFLTAVVLVVLLYILYHNKNKVSKVFFGLILEGRQGSRRRNSRGHAYRRLDTLEQAMSTKTTMPPSKIIY